MRRVLLSSVVVIFSLAAPDLAGAGARVIQVVPPANDRPAAAAPASAYETYHGYVFDLSENSERKDVAALADTLRRQLDVVESVGLSPRVLQYFRSVPIVASEMACLDEGAATACYGLKVPARDSHPRGLTTWDHDKAQWSNPDLVDLAVDSGRGVVMFRPELMKYAEAPVMLHEFLHVYHARLMPGGYENRGIQGFFAQAKAKGLYDKDAYLMKNNKEFFAVTASVFLAGKDAEHEPNTRAKLKENQPEYFKYLVGVFGFDPDAAATTPVASAN
jgi:hypothetical protein